MTRRERHNNTDGETDPAEFREVRMYNVFAERRARSDLVLALYLPRVRSSELLDASLALNASTNQDLARSETLPLPLSPSACRYRIEIG